MSRCVYLFRPKHNKLSHRGFHQVSCIRGKAKKQSKIERFVATKVIHHLGHNHIEKHDPQAGNEGRAITWVGVWVDVFLSAAKMAAGIFGNSSALIADSLHSLSDLVVDGVTLWTHHLARRPWSEQHPYGLGKFETIGAMAVSISLILTAIGIVMHSVSHFIHMTPEDIPTHVALIAAIISVLLKEALFRKTIAIAKAENSDLIAANAWHHRSDAISSMVALLGVGGAMVGFPLLDPLAGVVVAGLIAQTGYEMFIKSIKELTDNQEVDQETIQAISKLLQDSFVEIKGHHNLRSRKMGVYSLVDLHITVDPRTSVTSAHQIAEKARTTILQTFPQVREALIHVEGAAADGKNYHKEFKLHPSQKTVEDDIRKTLEKHFPKIIACHHFAIHYIGDQLEASLAISLADQTQITDAKILALEARKKILEEVPYITEIVIRLELTDPETLTTQQRKE